MRSEPGTPAVVEAVELPRLLPRVEAIAAQGEGFAV